MPNLIHQQNNTASRVRAFNARRRPQFSQRGVVLIIALIVLAAMTLAGVALVRSVDTANLVAGNIAFKQGTLQEGNAVMETAVQKFNLGNVMNATEETTWTSLPAQNYSAIVLPANEKGIATALVNAATDFDINPNYQIKKAIDPLSKNASRFLIERLCLDPGEPLADTCRFDPTGRAGAIDQRQSGLTNYAPMYRITVRVDGPNNTVSYTQAIISPSTSPGQ